MNRRKMTFAVRALALAEMLALSAVSVVAAVDPMTNWNTIAVQASLTAGQSAGAVASVSNFLSFSDFARFCSRCVY